MRLEKRREVKIREAGADQPLRKQAPDLIRLVGGKSLEAVEENLVLDAAENIRAQPRKDLLAQCRAVPNAAKPLEQAAFDFEDGFITCHEDPEESDEL